MNNKQFKPGFRLSMIDIIVLVVGIVGVCFYLNSAPKFSAIIAFVVAHFFLFCNLVRMSRLSELFWAGLFLWLCWVSLQFDVLAFYVVFILSVIVSGLLILLEMRKVSYHGVYWQVINPNLRTWFDSIDKD